MTATAVGTPLTARQKQVLRVMVRHFADQLEWPTIRQIGLGTGARSPNGVMATIRPLVAKGWLTHAVNQSRGYKVTLLKVMSPADVLVQIDAAPEREPSGTLSPSAVLTETAR